MKAFSSHKTEFKPALCAKEPALLPSSEAHTETLAHELLLPNVSKLVSFDELRNTVFSEFKPFVFSDISWTGLKRCFRCSQNTGNAFILSYSTCGWAGRPRSSLELHATVYNAVILPSLNCFPLLLGGQSVKVLGSQHRRRKQCSLKNSQQISG